MNAALQDALLDLLVRRMDSATSGASLVDWATQALTEDIDTEALVYLAGLPGDCSVFEASPLLDRALAELGVAVPEPPQLRRGYVSAVSRALLAGTIDAEAALERIHARAVGPLGHPPDLASWCYVWEGLDPGDYRSLSNSDVESAARRLAADWAAYQPLADRQDRHPGGGGA